MTVTLGSICSGYGGLEIGISQAIPGIRTRWFAEYEPPSAKKPRPKQHAALTLAHHWPDVPNLGDITTTRWADTPPVDIICGGTPCQDVSPAGPRAGMKTGTRSGIWASMAAAIEHHRPTLVVWENVGGALSAEADSNVEPCPICVGDDRDCHLRALGRVLGDLAEIGYDTVWCCVRASDIGAPHRRERVFVFAWPARNPADQFGERTGPVGAESARGSWPFGGAGRRAAEDADGATGGEWGIAAPGQAAPGWARAHPGGPDRAAVATDASSDGRDEGGTESAGQLGRPDASVRSPRAAADPDHEGREGPESARGRDLPDRGATADPDSGGREPVQPRLRPGQPDASGGSRTDWGEFGPAIHRWERILGRPAPNPTVLSKRGGQQLSPPLVEWMMGLPDGHVTSVPGLTRNEQLHQLGNGVVPQQAEHATRWALGHMPGWVRDQLGLPHPHAGAHPVEPVETRCG